MKLFIKIYFYHLNPKNLMYVIILNIGYLKIFHFNLGVHMNKNEDIKKETGIYENPLWTKDFTIITLGTVISKLGNAISGFAMSLLVLDLYKSTLMYALCMCVFSLSNAIVPALAGPYLDKFSRKKTIYTLDFLSAALYMLFGILLWKNSNVNYIIIILVSLILGVINSIYSVAYDSLYPLLVTKGNYTKAYSISSTLETLTMFMVPVSAYLYNTIGIGPLFLLDAVSFFIAAVFETQIKAKEEYMEIRTEKFTRSQYIEDFKQGIEYLKSEKGLLAITIYFAITTFAGSSYQTLSLPYFKETYTSGEYMFIWVMGFGVLGRFIGGAIHYKFKYPTDKKFTIALIVYFTISLIDGSMLYFPIIIMMILSFIEGIMGVTSYNIRVSATQSYVPHEKKGRFNGIFLMAITASMTLGQLISGALGDIVPKRLVVSAFMIFNLIGVIVVMYKNRNHVKPIYNRQA